MNKMSFIAALLAGILLSACAATGNAFPQRDWTGVSLQIEGGIQGVRRSIRVDPQGRLIVADDKHKSRDERQLTDQELRAVEESVSAFVGRDHSASRPRRTTPCADCVRVTLVVEPRSQRKPIEESWTSGSGAPAPELARLLLKLAQPLLHPQ